MVSMLYDMEFLCKILFMNMHMTDKIKFNVHVHVGLAQVCPNKGLGAFIYIILTS